MGWYPCCVPVNTKTGRNSFSTVFHIRKCVINNFVIPRLQYVYKKAAGHLVSTVVSDWSTARSAWPGHLGATTNNTPHQELPVQPEVKEEYLIFICLTLHSAHCIYVVPELSGTLMRVNLQ